jgi:hypothetical protein
VEWVKVNIAIKELLPIVLAVRKWGPLLANTRVLFQTDNQSIVYAINKQSCREKMLMNLVRQLVVASMTYNIDFQAEHIPGKSNITPDLLSRFQEVKARRHQPDLERLAHEIPQGWLPWYQ